MAGSKMLAAILARTGAPRKPVQKDPDRRGDLTSQFHAGTDGRGFNGSPTPARGKPVDRPGKPRRWPRPGEMEPKQGEE